MIVSRIASSRSLAQRLRYTRAVLRRFRSTVALVAVLFGVLPFCFVLGYPMPAGSVLSYGQALHHVYFLLFGQPSLEYVDLWYLELLNLVIPPFGIATVVDGAVRFSYLFNARARAEREWIELVAESLRNHVIVCGAGRIGYRVTQELLALKKEVVVVEKRPDAHFASVIRDMGVPIMIDNVLAPQTLPRLNVHHADAIVCATDDDLANINAALDARKLNGEIRIVMRLFDEDLVERVRDNFAAEALSTSALAAPALALTALDPRIMHSFHIGTHLMVVSRFVVGQVLAPMNLSQLRDGHGGLALSMKRGRAAEVLHPQGNTALQLGDELVVQCSYEDYLKLRVFTGEAKPPLATRPPVTKHGSGEAVSAN